MKYRPTTYQKHKEMLLVILPIIINASQIASHIYGLIDLNMLEVKKTFEKQNRPLFNRAYSAFMVARYSYDFIKESESMDYFNELELDCTNLHEHLLEMTLEDLKNVHQYLKSN